MRIKSPALGRRHPQDEAGGPWLPVARLASLKAVQTLAALNGALAPIAGGLSLPLMPFPLPPLVAAPAAQGRTRLTLAEAAVDRSMGAPARVQRAVVVSDPATQVRNATP